MDGLAKSLELVSVEALEESGSLQGSRYVFRYRGSQFQAAFVGSEVRIDVGMVDRGWEDQTTLQLSAGGFSPIGGFPSEADAVDAVRLVAAEILRCGDRVVEDGSR